METLYCPVILVKLKLVEKMSFVLFARLSVWVMPSGLVMRVCPRATDVLSVALMLMVTLSFAKNVVAVLGCGFVSVGAVMSLMTKTFVCVELVFADVSLVITR